MMLRVRQILVGAGIALAVAQAAGASLLLGAHQCREGCADDIAAGQCAPGCHDCAGCTPLRGVTPREQVTMVPCPAGRPLGPVSALMPSSAEPREILHVPKPLAACIPAAEVVTNLSC
jgi:hypothetical protein